ncbi:EH domain-containing protein 1-like [Ovis aries]|uniref:EH domain-containing protein 1-like n=1 Tax=Ovis aries TaxID=9940 RepID=UPI0029528C56|nr:EH domain-containing protein 1-like [Ovis aries]
MFSWVSKDARRKKEPELFQTVSEGLRQLYAQKLLPLEEHCHFHEFHSAALEDADFDDKPMVLLVGQYSTGKTTFIRHPMGAGLPGDAHRARAHHRGHARPHRGRGAWQRARRRPAAALPQAQGLRQRLPQQNKVILVFQASRGRISCEHVPSLTDLLQPHAP